MIRWSPVLLICAACGGRVVFEEQTPRADASSNATTTTTANACDAMCKRWEDDLDCPPNVDGPCRFACAENLALHPACRDAYQEYLGCVATESTTCDVPPTCLTRWQTWADCAGG